MADIELVIKIPEEMYKWIYDVNKFSNDYGMGDFIDLIKNGIPLPKEHGRLIDADSMKTMKNIQSANFNAVALIRLWIDKQDTIIEAEKESEE